MLRVRQAWRFVRVLVACVVLAFAARPAPSGPVWTEVPVLIARAAVAPPVARAPQAARPRFVRPVAELVRAPLAPALGPAEVERGPRVVLDRYLENCALLC
jgi:hypothetical protein